MSGYSGTPLAKKLGIRAHTRLVVRAAPDNYRALLAPLPEGVQSARRIDSRTDLIHLFATRATALRQGLAAARRTMRMDAVIWVSWVCAVDETWSGLKLVLRVSERRP
jgi:hypothetical protein